MIDEKLHSDFYIGDSVGKLKLMDYQTLVGYQATIKNVKLFYSFYWQKGIVKLALKKYQTYIITGEFYCLSTWLLLLLCKLRRKQTLLWTHGWYGRESKLKKIVKKIFLDLSSDILLYGEYAKRLMIEEGYDANKLHVIANSLSYDAQLEIRKKLVVTNIYKEHFRNDNPTLIFVGRLTKVKKIDLLIAAIEKLHVKGFDVNLVLVGDIMEEFPVEKILYDKHLCDKIWLYGCCYDENKLGELLYNATVCVSPGNVGLTAIHAFTYGCPVITHNNFANQMPEFEVITPNVTGDFFKENDFESLAASIEKWVNKTTDRTEVRKMCYDIIDKKFNPYYQITILQKIIRR